MTETTQAALSHGFKLEAKRLGFDLCGVCPAIETPGIDRFRTWLTSGFAGQMQYLANRAGAYSHPSHVLDGVRSIIMLAMNYRTAEQAEGRAGQGRVSRYAWGTDYHEVIRDRLESLAAWFQEQSPGAMTRGVVDTAPILEREFAQLAGLGWIGKNTLLLNKRLGSWFFLAALLTDLELDYDVPHETDHCGTCRACLDACPTQAFVDAYVLDARRCISYLTIELRDAVPGDLRAGIGDWLFGCDVCQDVCPWNRRAPVTSEPAFKPLAETNPVDLAALFDLDEAGFRARFRNTPLWRAKRRGLLRNAAIVLGNQQHADALPALTRGLNDAEPLVRGACAWAIGNHRGQDALSALGARLAIESDAAVRFEIERSRRSFRDHPSSQPAVSSTSAGCCPGRSLQ
jgi:epoxyqueuosine reductase